MKTSPSVNTSNVNTFPFALQSLKHAVEALQERGRVKKEEKAAKRRSALIDEDLKQQRSRVKQEAYRSARIMLVGFPGSGKSTTVKYFRTIYEKERWEAERPSWRAIILLNTIQSFIHLFEFDQEGLFTDEQLTFEGDNLDHALLLSQAEVEPVSVRDHEGTREEGVGFSLQSITVQGISTSKSSSDGGYATNSSFFLLYTALKRI
ncbi:G-protein alpha subunit-domain-containing protein [Gymnopilus junonius]|uniref:G-protein alpha subunit-domain-containing protein n=1 Tax=Gymnopilus junonius TaxID=109634 RepID=A0A9P5NFI1_GYMJU|nr:G-protein alpha subunit-domain-containing protein [Gymnopilus junonius]